MDSTPVSIPVDDSADPMPAHLFLPAAGSGPGVVLIQEIFGVSDYIRRRAADLAALGHVVVVPEIYWRLDAEHPIEGEGSLERAMQVVGQLDWQRAVLDGAEAVAWLRDRPEVDGPAALVGFCFGGGLAFQIAALLETTEGPEVTGTGPIDALVSYYGSALPGLHDVMSVRAPSLHHFGLDDSFIDAETVAQIESSLTQQPATVFITYPGADHAFDNNDAPWFHEGASKEAWARTVEFLEEHLPVGAA